ncbi:hypothetical protein DV737_g5272, partial [Chaetothyriales sp. CBS 132003]
MDRCAPEILHHIFKRLQSPSEITALRLAGRKYATVGAEYLAPRVRFHASKSSVERLNAFMQHPVFRQHVQSLVFEGSLLLPPGCIHWFCSLPLINDDHPSAPPADASVRTRRLYERNLAKWEAEAEEKYERYCSLYSAQRELIKSNLFQDTISQCAKAFPHLKEVLLVNVARCTLHLPQQFVNDFDISNLLLLESSANFTAGQLQQLEQLLCIQQEPVMGLTRLQAKVLDPRFFLNPATTAKIGRAFASLKHLKLTFRMNYEDEEACGLSAHPVYEQFNSSNIGRVLAAATELEQLYISFHERGPPIAKLDDIVGNISWPKLTKLEVEFVTIDSADSLIAILQRQPSLKTLSIAWAQLLRDTWATAVTNMRRSLDLDLFYAGGLLIDDTIWDTERVNAEWLRESGESIQMMNALDLYVTEKNTAEEDDEIFNPFLSEWIDE